MAPVFVEFVKFVAAFTHLSNPAGWSKIVSMTRLQAFLCAAALAILIFLAPTGVPAQENGETGSSDSTTGNSTNGALSPTMNLDSFKEIRPRQSQSTIVGIAMLDDGSVAPMGTIIVSDCAGKRTKEAIVDESGRFKFQSGANSDSLAEANDGSFLSSVDASQSLSSSSPIFPDEDLIRTVRPQSCELRAQLDGHRSNSVPLPLFKDRETHEIGTIVLCPASKISGSAVSATDQAAPKDARKALERADKEYQKKNPDEAAKYLQIAVKDYSGYASAWFRLGQIHIESYQLAEARNAFSKAIDADTKYVSPLVELARLEAGESNWYKAAELTERALDLNPLDFPDAYYIHALASMNLNRIDAAERSARKLVPLDALPRWPEVHMILADILREKQDVSGEMAELQTYLKHAPESFTRDEAISRLRDLENEKQQQ
jgi:hypothetical protein